MHKITLMKETGGMGSAMVVGKFRCYFKIKQIVNKVFIYVYIYVYQGITDTYVHICVDKIKNKREKHSPKCETYRPTVIIRTVTTKLLGGMLVSLCLSVCLSLHSSIHPSVSPSRIPCPLCSAYSSGWIRFIFINFIKQLQKVCHIYSWLQNL